MKAIWKDTVIGTAPAVSLFLISLAQSDDTVVVEVSLRCPKPTNS